MPFPELSENDLGPAMSWPGDIGVTLFVDATGDWPSLVLSIPFQLPVVLQVPVLTLVSQEDRMAPEICTSNKRGPLLSDLEGHISSPGPVWLLLPWMACCFEAIHWNRWVAVSGCTPSLHKMHWSLFHCFHLFIFFPTGSHPVTHLVIQIFLQIDIDSIELHWLANQWCQRDCPISRIVASILMGSMIGFAAWSWAGAGMKILSLSCQIVHPSPCKCCELGS